MKELTYKFKVGQSVDLIPSISRFAANGHYQIVSLRPADREIPQYRIKNRHELHERVVAENDLILAEDMKFDRALEDRAYRQASSAGVTAEELGIVQNT